MLPSLSCLFVGILLALSAETQAKVSPGHIKEETASYKSAAGTFEIKAVLREVTEPYTFQHLKVDYSVKQNGKFLHRSDLTGGSTWGCLYGDDAAYFSFRQGTQKSARGSVHLST